MRRFFISMFSAALLGAVTALGQTNTSPEADCREHLQTLGFAFTRYLLHHEGQPPTRVSDLHRESYVLDLDTFVCPASATRITNAADIDALTDYELVKEITGEKPLLIARDKAGFHDGQAQAFYSDRSVKRITASPPVKRVPPPETTNAPAITRTEATNVPPVAVTNIDGTATLTLTNKAQQALALDFLGKEHFRNGRLAEAEAAFRQAAQADPSNAWHFYNVAYVLSQQGKWKESEAPVREAVRVQPTNVPARVMLGHALTYQMNWSEAEAAYRESIKLEGTNGMLHQFLANALRGAQKLTEAEAEYRAAAEMMPNNSQVQLELGHVYVIERKWPEAEKQYREVLRLEPQNAAAHCGLGHVFMGQSRFAEAENSYRAAIRMNPQFAQFHADLAGALLGAGRQDEARAPAQEAIRLGHKQHWVYQRLGLTP